MSRYPIKLENLVWIHGDYSMQTNVRDGQVEKKKTCLMEGELEGAAGTCMDAPAGRPDPEDRNL
jgi:hypothetical protein